tara:strand:+ start:1825 stop:2043 length:219 start_codon:yes stop_codon:yes gene_type:complete
VNSLYTLGNKIIDQETLIVDGVFVWDYPEFCDAYFSFAKDIEGNELYKEELDKLTDKYPELVNELALKKMFE